MISLLFGISLGLMSQAEMARAPETIVEKEVVYKKETTIDLSGSEVKGEGQLPPAFFVQKMNTPQGESLLNQRLKFKMKNVNELGF